MNTGSGITVVGYFDPEALVVYCRTCGDNGDGMFMDAIYSTDLDAETQTCFSCNATLEA